MQELEQDIAQLQKVYDIIMEFLVAYSFQLLGALFVLLIGMFIANKVSKGVMRLCEKKALDVTLSRFIANVVKVLVITMIAVVCLNMIGISITPFVAAIGAASLGAGLAVQGLLSNYGAGFNIIITRPFVVGDTITVQGVAGEVVDIHLAHTILQNEDGVTITIPNRHIIGEILHNSQKDSLVELEVGIAYASDLDQVISILHTVLSEHNLVSQESPPQVGIDAFGDSSVNLMLRCWVPTNKMMAARFELNKLVWDTLQRHNVEIPFPQREIKMLS